MIQLIKQVALEVIRSSNPVELIEAEVVSAPPELNIKLKSDSQLIIPKELIIVAERLAMSGIKAGDEIMVVSLQGGQFFYVMDRAVRY